MRTLRNLALIGFMGTGKTSVGRLAATALHFDFVDTDKWVEEETGLTVEKIFQQQGEPAFRQWEKQAVQELAKMDGKVIATGGGLGADGDNLASLKTHALVICLWATPEAIWERVRSQTHRPLLQTPDPLQKITELLARREPVYRQADVLLQTHQRSARDVAQQVVLQFQLARG